MADEERVGRYLIGETIHEGARPWISDARDEAGTRYLFVSFEDFAPQESLERWRTHETDAEAKLVDYGEHPDWEGWAVYTRPPGDTLAATLAGFGWFDDEHGRATLAAICDALSHRHEAGRAHVMFFLAPHLVWLDAARAFLAPSFGAGEHVPYDPFAEFPPRPGGDDRYAAFAVIAASLDRAVTPRTDVFLLGMLAYELFTGRTWWNGDEYRTALLVGGIAERASDHAKAAGLPTPPPWFDAWFAKATAHDPKRRFANAREAKEALGKMEEALKPPPPPEPLPTQRATMRVEVRRRSMVVPLAIALVVVLTIAAIVRLAFG